VVYGEDMRVYYGGRHGEDVSAKEAGAAGVRVLFRRVLYVYIYIHEEMTPFFFFV
jgi:acid phosphatase class B